MGIVRTLRGEDGRPYISLEDLIREVRDVKKSNESVETMLDDRPNFVDVVLKTLNQMESEYYEKYLFKKKDDPQK